MWFTVSGSGAERFVAACPKGATVVARVDPGNPAEAVLVPGIRPVHVVVATLAGLALVETVAMAVFLPAAS